MKIDEVLGRVGETAGRVVSVIVPIIVYGTYAYFTRNDQRREEKRVIYCDSYPKANSTYSNAVSAITNSNMSSYYKAEAINVLSRYEDDAYYEAVISIANDKTMSSYYKKEAIRNLTI